VASPPKDLAFSMELFLNLCWLSLLLPAYLLWRQRTFATAAVACMPCSKRSSAHRPLIFLCVLGCALVLLFPVISASDDLHAMRPEMEESERSFRHAGHCASASHAFAQSSPFHRSSFHRSPFVLTSSASLARELEPLGNVLLFTPPALVTPSANAPVGRAPPSEHPTSL
jgi:hypothetical protein